MNRRSLLAAAVAASVDLVVRARSAAAATATTGPLVQHWQARRIVRAHAALQYRPDFRVEGIIRRDAQTIAVDWSEPGYLGPDDGRDYGRDVVQRRRGEWWLFDDSGGGGWLRWL